MNIVVIGSMNMDYVLTTDNLPKREKLFMRLILKLPLEEKEQIKLLQQEN